MSSNNALPALVDLNLEELTAENLLQYQSRLVSHVKLEIVEITTPNNAIQFKLKNEAEETIILRVDTRLNLEDMDALEIFEVGDFVTIRGATLAWFNNPQLMIDNVNQMTMYLN